VKHWEENDPIGIYNKYILDNSLASAEELTELEQKAAADVVAAVQFAESSPEPAPEALWENVYVGETYGTNNHA